MSNSQQFFTEKDVIIGYETWLMTRKEKGEERPLDVVTIRWRRQQEERAEYFG